MTVPKPRTDKVAEGIFEQLCHASGLTANRSGDDQNGWDFIVEFPSQEGQRPPDLWPPGLTCLVQVKSSASAKRGYRVKASNALKFAHNPLPCFTFMVLFEADGVTPSKFLLQHFWKPQIASALKAIRVLHAKGVERPNRNFVTFQFELSDVVSRAQVIERIAAHASAPNDYSATKRKYADSVGFENGAGTGTFTIEDEHLESFVDVMLGLEKDVPVTSFVLRPERFGIPEREVVDLGAGGRLSVSAKPAAKCIVVASSPDRCDQIVLNGDIFFPQVLHLPHELRKIRIRTELIDFTCRVRPDELVAFGDFNASFATKEPASLETLQNVAALWSWLGTGEIGLEVRWDGRRLLEGEIEVHERQGSGYWGGAV